MSYKYKLGGLCATTAFVLSACVTTETATTTSAAEAEPMVKNEAAQMAETEADYDPNKKVCKRQSIPGSNFKKKVCMTLQQWKDMQQDSRDATNRIQDRNRGFEPQR